jgi:hypothetical protein
MLLRAASVVPPTFFSKVARSISQQQLEWGRASSPKGI